MIRVIISDPEDIITMEQEGDIESYLVEAFNNIGVEDFSFEVVC